MPDLVRQIRIGELLECRTMVDARVCMPDQAVFPEGSITCINNGYRVAGIRSFRKGMYVVFLSSSFVHELNPKIGCHMNRG